MRQEVALNALMEALMLNWQKSCCTQLLLYQGQLFVALGLHFMIMMSQWRHVQTELGSWHQHELTAESWCSAAGVHDISSTDQSLTPDKNAVRLL